jgi:hypothetical protein
MGKLHFFSEFSAFFEKKCKKIKKKLKKFKFFSETVSENRNLNFVTSELDSESLSTLQKIIFKRDSCKVDDRTAPVINSCAMSKCQSGPGVTCFWPVRKSGCSQVLQNLGTTPVSPVSGIQIPCSEASNELSA